MTMSRRICGNQKKKLESKENRQKQPNYRFHLYTFSVGLRTPPSQFKIKYVPNLNSGFPDKIPYMDEIKKDWQTRIFETAARKSPQIIPLFKYLYVAII